MYEEKCCAGQAALAGSPEFVSDPWKHRCAGMRCMTCMWFVAKETNRITARDNEIGRCRRHCPSMGGYPVVKSQDWCGDHRLDENK